MGLVYSLTHLQNELYSRIQETGKKLIIYDVFSLIYIFLGLKCKYH